MKKIVLLTLCLFSLASFGGAISLEEAKRASAKDGKPILIDFYAVWCGPCKVFTRDSNRDKDMKAALKDVHLVKIDAEKGRGIALARQFKVKGFPTFAITNPAMETLHLFSGYSKEYFLAELKKGIGSKMSIDERLAKYYRKKTVKEAEFFADYHAGRGELDKALAMYRDADTLNPEKSYGYETFFVNYRMFTREKMAFEALETEANNLLKGELDKPYDWYVTSIMIAASKQAKNEDSLTAFLKNSRQTLDQYKDKKWYGSSSQFLDIDLALHLNKDIPAAITLKKESMAHDWEENPNRLNAFAWWCFENKVNMEEGLVLAKKGVDLATDKDKPSIIDTWAELENALGNPAKAAEIMEKAIALEPDKEMWTKQRDRFRDLAKSGPGGTR